MSMTAKDFRSSLLLFFDFETTGLGKLSPIQILETTAVLYDVETDQVLENNSNTWLTLPDGDVEASLEDQHVVEMHAKSGLTKDLLDDSIPKWTLHQVESEIVKNISLHSRSGQTVFLAGNGVSGYDQPLVDQHMPILASRLHYRVMDVSTVRNFLLLSGFDISWGEGVFRNPGHRSFDDVMQSIEQYRWLGQHISIAP